MSQLSCGIVGLPNVGKSTLFNALLKKQQAFVANYPFATIEPNVGIVPVPDSRLAELAKIVEEEAHLPPGSVPRVPATIKFIDIAGLVAGAHKGEGLGNQFLAHIREADLICHVLRDFSDENVARAGSQSPKQDLDTIRTELILADLQTLEKQSEPKGQLTSDQSHRWQAVQKLKKTLETGQPASKASLTQEEAQAAKDLFLLTAKPEIFVINTTEPGLKKERKQIAKDLQVEQGSVILLSALTEVELATLSKEDQAAYLTELGITTSGLDQLAHTAYNTLDLISFFTTTGLKEVRAWSLKRGSRAIQAAALIHTDFTQKFIKAGVVPYHQFISAGSWQKTRETGKVQTHGRDHEIKDGDVVEFKIGT